MSSRAQTSRERSGVTLAKTDKHPGAPGAYRTPDACEAAFYDAFRTGDLGLMEQVWNTVAGVTCAHPGRPPLAGRRAVMQSWSDILSATGGVQVRFDCQDRVQAGSLAVHMGLEIIGAEDDEPALVTVTNVYELTAEGWKLRAHHGAPVHRGAGGRGPLH